MLYRVDISEGGGGKGAAQGLIENHSASGGSESSYGHIIGEGVMSNIAEIDRLIDGASKNWSITRMTVVDRNILRIAVYELLYHSDVPCKVVMDQSVELANRFGAENSAPFINGVIDNVYKEVLSGRHPSRRDSAKSEGHC